MAARFRARRLSEPRRIAAASQQVIRVESPSEKFFDSATGLDDVAGQILETMFKDLPIVCVAAALSLSVLCGQAAEKAAVDLSKIPPPSNKTGVTYAVDIKPIFDKSCIKCHGGEKPKGKLRLDSLAGVLKGGEDGKVVLPGNGTGSMLVHNIAHAGDPDDYMPPPKNKDNIPPLAKDQIGLIRAWIDQGAK